MRLKSGTIVSAVLLFALLLRSSLLALDLDLHLVGAYNANGAARDVAVSGNYAYLADAIGGLQVIDVSNPANCVQVGGYDFNAGYDPVPCCMPFWYARSVAVSGRYAYVTADRFIDEGLSEYLMQVIDVSNPTNCVVVGDYYGSRQAWDVAVSGNYAYVANLHAGLQIIDVSNPTDCARVGDYNTSGDAFDVAVADNYAYVADYNSGLQVIDVRNPANPQRVGSYDTGGAAVGVVVSRDYAYVLTSVGFQVIDVSNPANLQRVGTYDAERYGYGGVAVSGNYTYVGGGGPLQVIDVSDPANPQRVGRYDTSAYGVAVSSNYVYVAAGDAGLQVIAVNPANPQRVGSHDTAGSAKDVAVSGKFAYVADGRAGLQVIDTGNLANPQHVGGYLTIGEARAVAVSGSYAYVAEVPIWDGTNYVGGGLLVLDISNPANPQRTASYGSGYYEHIAVSGTYAYIANGFEGLQVIDISNPALPRYLAGGYTTDGYTRRLSVSGNHAYVINQSWRCAAHSCQSEESSGVLRIIDISDPSNPRSKSSYSVSAEDIAVFGNYALVPELVLSCSDLGCGVLGRGLHVIDISDPADPKRVGRYDATGSHRVAICGNYAYLTEGVWSCESGFPCFIMQGSVDVIDISNPLNPRLVGRNPSFPQQSVNGITVTNGNVFVAAGEKGLIILHDYQPLRFERVARRDDGAMRLRIAGPPGVPGRLQRSSDLRTWTDWLPVEFGESMIEISDPDARTEAARFYRIAVP